MKLEYLEMEMNIIPIDANDIITKRTAMTVVVIQEEAMTLTVTAWKMTAIATVMMTATEIK